MTIDKSYQKLIDVIPDNYGTSFDFVGTYNGVNYTVFDSDFFVSEIIQNFRNRKIYLDTENPATDLVNLFHIFNANRADTYGRRMYALSIDYNPLENYNGSETYTETVSGSNTENSETSYGRTDTTAGTAEETTTGTTSGTGSGENVNLRYAYDSSAFVNTDKQTHSEETTGSTSGTKADTTNTTNTAGGSDSTEKSGTNTETRSHTLTKSGNLGVTTSQQMLASDLDMLKYDIAKACLYEFLDSYTLYIYPWEEDEENV